MSSRSVGIHLINSEQLRKGRALALSHAQWYSGEGITGKIGVACLSVVQRKLGLQQRGLRALATVTRPPEASHVCGTFTLIPPDFYVRVAHDTRR